MREVGRWKVSLASVLRKTRADPGGAFEKVQKYRVLPPGPRVGIAMSSGLLQSPEQNAH